MHSNALIALFISMQHLIATVVDILQSQETEIQTEIRTVIVIHSISVAQCPKHDLAQSALHKKIIYIFTLYRTSVIILTPPLLRPHSYSVVKLRGKGALQTKREPFFKKMFSDFS